MDYACVIWSKTCVHGGLRRRLRSDRFESVLRTNGYTLSICLWFSI